MSEVFKAVTDLTYSVFAAFKNALAFAVRQSIIAGEFYRNSITPFFGPALPYVKLISFVLSGVLLWGIIFTIARSGYLAYRLDTTLDFWRLRNIFKRRSLRVWTSIKKLMRNKNKDDWKKALFQTEDLLNAVIKQSGFPGRNLDERLENINIEQLSNIEEVRKTHKVIEKMKANPELELTKEEAESLLEVYESALKELELLD